MINYYIKINSVYNYDAVGTDYRGSEGKNIFMALQKNVLKCVDGKQVVIFIDNAH